MLLQLSVLNRRGVIVYNVELGTSICPRVSACSCLTRSGWREKMQCPAGMQSRHSSVSDFSFPLGMAAMLGPGLQQEAFSPSYYFTPRKTAWQLSQPLACLVA